MVSEAKKKRAAAKKEKVAAVTGQPLPSQREAANESASSSTNDLAQVENGVNGLHVSDRACTGNLTSHPQSRDIHFESFSLLFHGHELLQDSDLELNYGRSAAFDPVANGSPVLAYRTLFLRAVKAMAGLYP